MPIKQVDEETSYNAPVYYNEKPLTGAWSVYYKIDGVRALRNKDGKVVSRKNKPLYNLDHLYFTDAEIFRKDWNTTVSLVRTESTLQIEYNDVYQLDPPDPRLYFTVTNNTGETVPLVVTAPEPLAISGLLAAALSRGYEGIVLRNSKTKKWIKVVPEMTADIRVTGFTMSTKRTGWIKNFETNYGNISATSFPESELVKIQHNTPESYIGEIMEVKFRERYKETGKLRFAKFNRWRFEKDTESIPELT